jgi:hypothetical protein
MWEGVWVKERLTDGENSVRRVLAKNGADSEALRL